MVHRWFSLQDGIVFDNNGAALSPDGGTSIQRQNRISWAYMLRRPRASVPDIVDMSIVVYNNRPGFSFAPEATYLALGDKDDNSLLVQWTTEDPPAIRKGTWILDATSELPGAGPAAQLAPDKYGPFHSYFYRVIGAYQLPNQNKMVLELEQTLKAPVQLIAVMENVVEVFENGAGSRPF
jgi:hypothetical protein